MWEFSVRRLKGRKAERQKGRTAESAQAERLTAVPTVCCRPRRPSAGSGNSHPAANVASRSRRHCPLALAVPSVAFATPPAALGGNGAKELPLPRTADGR